MVHAPKLVILFVFHVPFTARAQGLFESALEGNIPAREPESVEALVPQAPAPAYELNGFVRGDLFVYQAPDVNDAAHINTAYGEAALKLRARTGSLGDAYGEIRANSGLVWGEKRTNFDLREALVNLYLGPVDVRLGHQIIVWGRADGINPTNNLTPTDMSIRSADEDDRRLANLALRTHLNLEPVRLEVVWVPFYAATRLPPFEMESPLIRG